MSARPIMTDATAIPAVAPVLRPDDELPVLAVGVTVLVVDEEALVLEDAAKGN